MFKSNKLAAFPARFHAPIELKIPMVAAGGHSEAAIATPTIDTSKPRATIIPAAKPPSNASEMVGTVKAVRFKTSE